MRSTTQSPAMDRTAKAAGMEFMSCEPWPKPSPACQIRCGKSVRPPPGKAAQLAGGAGGILRQPSRRQVFRRFPDPMSGSCVSRTCIPSKQEREPSERSASADRAIRRSPCGEATGCGGDKPGSSPRLPPSNPKSAMGGELPFPLCPCCDAHCFESGLKLPRFRGVELDLGDYGSVVTASIAAS